MDDRVIELETRVAFQEEAILKLTQAVEQQERELYRMSKEVARLKASLTALEPSGLGPLDEEPPPPHY
ncbi:MAG: SlyX family protein [Deltaproteobacteria bacterium]|nr:SlyX family protein [Deltaproteobacteria bacterium]